MYAVRFRLSAGLQGGGRKMATSGRADETLSQADWRHSEQRHSTRPCLSHRRQEGKPTEHSLFCGLAPSRIADLRASEQSPKANIARTKPFPHLDSALNKNTTTPHSFLLAPVGIAPRTSELASWTSEGSHGRLAAFDNFAFRNLNFGNETADLDLPSGSLGLGVGGRV